MNLVEVTLCWVGGGRDKTRACFLFYIDATILMQPLHINNAHIHVKLVAGLGWCNITERSDGGFRQPPCGRVTCM